MSETGTTVSVAAREAFFTVALLEYSSWRADPSALHIGYEPRSASNYFRIQSVHKRATAQV